MTKKLLKIKDWIKESKPQFEITEEGLIHRLKDDMYFFLNHHYKMLDSNINSFLIIIKAHEDKIHVDYVISHISDLEEKYKKGKFTIKINDLVFDIRKRKYESNPEN